MHFEHSPKVKDLQRRFVAFMREHIYPNEATFHRQIAEGDRWQPTAIVEELKPKARAAGLWNLFLPDSEYGAGLTNVEYAPLCEIMGRVSPFAPEVFNCSAPDTGNMEVLVRYGTETQRKQWLEPLLAGTIRSCFAMKRPCMQGFAKHSIYAAARLRANLRPTTMLSHRSVPVRETEIGLQTVPNRGQIPKPVQTIHP